MSYLDEIQVNYLNARVDELLAERDSLKAINAELLAALKKAQSAIKEMKTSGESAAQGDEQMMLDAITDISHEGLLADMAIRAAIDNAIQEKTK